MRLFGAILFVFTLVQNCRSDGMCDFFYNLAANITAPCLKQLDTVCNNSTLAWQMFDASSKLLTSGMTYSNVIDYGNFPECLAIDYEDQDGRIIGKYCGLSVIIVNIFLTPQTEKLLTRYGFETKPTSPQTISRDLFETMDAELRDVLIDDVPYVLSKYSSCVPDACTPREVGYFYLFGHLPARIKITGEKKDNLKIANVIKGMGMGNEAIQSVTKQSINQVSNRIFVHH
jgi:hypothetical protein